MDFEVIWEGGYIFRFLGEGWWKEENERRGEEWVFVEG